MRSGYNVVAFGESREAAVVVRSGKRNSCRPVNFDTACFQAFIDIDPHSEIYHHS